MVPGSLILGLQEPIQCLRFVTYVEKVFSQNYPNILASIVIFLEELIANMKLNKLQKINRKLFLCPPEE